MYIVVTDFLLIDKRMMEERGLHLLVSAVCLTLVALVLSVEARS